MNPDLAPQLQPGLYIVATPIGNLGDLSPRAAHVLANAGIIAVEDSRVTATLLRHIGVKGSMTPYHEILDMLGPYGIEPVSAAELDLPEPEETGTTFVANAELKALQAADLTGLPALADDSGLCVDALGGDPGIFSARWGGPDKDFGLAMQRVEDALKAIGPDASRAAHFICVLALAWPDGHVEWFEGRVDGTLVWPPRGTGGFGYNPVFQPLGSDQTFAEMPDAKKAISHRAVAFAEMMAAVL